MKTLLILLLTLNLYATKIGDVLTTSEMSSLSSAMYSNDEIAKFAKMKSLLPQPTVEESIRKITDSNIKVKKYCTVVNLKTDGGNKIVEACMQISTPMVEYRVKHNIIMIISSKTMEEVSSKKGKQILLAQIKDQVKATSNIYLTKFIISNQ